jgi:hypothetical protein
MVGWPSSENKDDELPKLCAPGTGTEAAELVGCNSSNKEHVLLKLCAPGTGPELQSMQDAAIPACQVHALWSSLLSAGGT